MRVFAHCDKRGTISSLIAFDAPDGMLVSLAPRAGEFVVEIEGLRFKGGAPDAAALEKLAQSHRVSKVTTRSTLAKRK